MYKLLLFIGLYLPFGLALNPVSGVDLASIRVLVILAFLLWLAQGLKHKNIVIKNSIQTWLIVSFLFLNLFSIIVAGNIDWSIRKLLFLFSIFPIYFVASHLISSRERMIKIIKNLVFSGTIVAGIGIAQFIAQFVVGFQQTYSFWAKYIIVPFLGNSFGEAVLKNPSWLVNIAGKTYLRATSLFPDPHMFAFYLGLLIPLVLGVALNTKKQKSFWLISFMILLVADLLTFSRGGYLGLFAGLIFAGAFFWEKIGRKYKIATAMGIMLILAVMIIPSPISQRFLSSFDLKEGSNQGRLAMWTKAVDVSREHSLIGVGIGNYPLEVVPTATYRDPIYAHNTYLDIAAETGIVNSIIWVLILITALYGFWKKSAENNIFFFLAMSLVIFSTHSVVETALYSPVVLTLFLILISLNQNFKTVQDIRCPTSNEGEEHPMSSVFLKMKKLFSLENFIYFSIIAIPSYAIRFSVFGIPTNLFELFALLAIMMFFIKRESSKFDLREYKNYLIPIVMIMVGLILSSIVNEAYRSGLGAMKSWLVIPMLFAFIATKEIKKDEYKNIFKALYASAFLISCIALAYFITGKVTFDGRLQTFYNSPNYLAMYIAPAVLLGLAFFKENKKVYGLSLGVILIALYLTFSYAAWLAIVASGLSLFIFSKKRVKIGQMIAGLVAIVAIFVLLQGGTKKMEGLINLEERSSASSRIMIWTSADKIIQDNWLFGIGSNQFQNKYLEYQKYFPPYLEWSVPQPHNLLLAFWLQAGIIGLAGFGFLVWQWLKQLVKEDDFWIASASLAVVAYVLGHGLFDTTYFKNDLAAVFWLSLLVITKKRI